MRTPSKQTGPVYLGLGVLLITLSFLFTGILFPFVGSRERTVFFIFPGHFHQKWGYISTSDFNLCQRQDPAFCYSFFLTYDLYFPSIIISSSELWPTEVRMADRKDSASKKNKRLCIRGQLKWVYSVCLKLALPTYAFSHLNLISICLFTVGFKSVFSLF